MAVLIPAPGSCVSRMTPGVRRLAERLAHKRDSGDLPWHWVPTALRNQQFSFKSVGIQAQGCTTALKTNYPNTKQILQTASLVAADRLRADDKDDDGIPLPKPIRCGREGEAPLIIRLPTLRDETFAMADGLGNVHKEGRAWGDMAILCHDYPTMDLCARALEHRRLPFDVRKRTGDFRPGANAIQVMTMKVSKGLEFPVVALPGVGHMPAAGEDEQEAAQVFYVAATRATQVIGVGGDRGVGAQISATEPIQFTNSRGRKE
nr:3'-5' exonuclease [uncultured Albidiferax sp.]